MRSTTAVLSGAGLLLLATVGVTGWRWADAVEKDTLELPAISDERGFDGRPSLEYQGDADPFVLSSKVFARLSPAGQKALLTVANARLFTSRHVGLGGVTPSAVFAFDLLLVVPASEEAFWELSTAATSAGRLFGLCGLRAKGSARLAAAREGLAGDSSPVDTLRGCIGMTETVRSVVSNLDQNCDAMAQTGTGSRDGAAGGGSDGS